MLHYLRFTVHNKHTEIYFDNRSYLTWLNPNSNTCGNEFSNTCNKLGNDNSDTREISSFKMYNENVYGDSFIINQDIKQKQFDYNVSCHDTNY